MMIKYLFLFIFLITLTGCQSVPPIHYKVYISPKFNHQDIAKIKDGVLEWNRLLIKYPPQFEFYIREVNNYAKPQYNTIYIYPSFPLTNELGWTSWWLPNNMAWVRLMDMDKEDFKPVVMHEIGHALGLEHAEKNTIMCQYSGCMSDFITATDIKHLCAVHKDWCGP